MEATKFDYGNEKTSFREWKHLLKISTIFNALIYLIDNMDL